MDSMKFDSLSKRVFRQTTRRQAVAALAGGLVAAVGLGKTGALAGENERCNRVGYSCSPNAANGYTRGCCDGIACTEDGTDQCCISTGNRCDPDWVAPEVYADARQCCDPEAVCAAKPGYVDKFECQVQTCVPLTCDGQCGQIADGCGGKLDCGKCPTPPPVCGTGGYKEYCSPDCLCKKSKSKYVCHNNECTATWCRKGRKGKACRAAKKAAGL